LLVWDSADAPTNTDVIHVIAHMHRAAGSKPYTVGCIRKLGGRPRINQSVITSHDVFCDASVSK